MKLKFSGLRVLILGGSCDLALELAELVVQEGLFPILTWRDGKGRKLILSRLQAFEGSFSTFCLDLRDRASIDSLFDHVGNDLDYLVDFVQGDMESLIGAANSDAVRGYFQENVSSRAEILKKAARIMLGKRRGRLIFVSSAAASKPNQGQGFYAAAKLASEALYRNLGIELGGRGITTLTLRPGYIDAGRGRSYLEAHSEEALRAVPTGRALTCREVAEAILYFLSDSASGFNAVEVPMDGGMTAGT
jgi:3-oxoacyl-[acyl-carrier protein] reductase